jgi:hypothetical protein
MARHYHSDVIRSRIMAGLVPAIYVLSRRFKDVDARHEAGHDGSPNS